MEKKAKKEQDLFDALRTGARILHEDAVVTATIFEGFEKSSVIYTKDQYIDLLKSLKPIYLTLSTFPSLLKDKMIEHRPLTKELMDNLHLEYSKEQHIYETDLESLTTDTETLNKVYDNFISALNEYEYTKRDGNSVNTNCSIMTSKFD